MNEQIKVGTRVRYRAALTGASRTPRMEGWYGTVREVGSNWLGVKWDNGEEQGCFLENVEPYVSDPIKEAIALLKQHGTVTFIPKFKPVTIKLNGEYDAVIHEDHVKVGCQQFKFDKVLELAIVVQKVKASLKY